MCAKAKSFVKVHNALLLLSHTGLLQGENLSTVIFSPFLNDLFQYRSDKFVSNYVTLSW